MLSETERDALEDIRDNIARAMRFVAGLDLDAFLADDKTFYAATRCLEIISEASRRLPPAFKERWGRIGTRGRIVDESYQSEVLAADAMRRQAERKRRRGYAER
jgi:uncharacterized protein with HEPN domain